MAPFIDVTFQLLIFFMLTIKFKQEEGHLLALLPNRGTHSGPAVWTEEVRAYICADNVSKRFDQHIGVKESHQQTVASLLKQAPNAGDLCHVWIELQTGKARPLYRTDRFPSRAAENKRTYALIAEELRATHQVFSRSAPVDKKIRAVIDCDGLVPWEHAFGLLNALQRIKMFDIEWAGNPRFDRYFGPN